MKIYDKLYIMLEDQIVSPVSPAMWCIRSPELLSTTLLLLLLFLLILLLYSFQLFFSRRWSLPETMEEAKGLKHSFQTHKTLAALIQTKF